MLNTVSMSKKSYPLTSTNDKVSTIVSAHRRILGMAPVVCVLVKICVSSISFYKLDTDKLTNLNQHINLP